MALEDHLGDIIRKGRAARNVPAADAAKAAGISESDLATLEETGFSAKPLHFAALGPVIGLNAAKLEKIAGGWLPAPPKLELWRELRRIPSHSGGMGVNCYLIWDETSREAALFDTGFDAKPVFSLIEKNGMALRHLFLTHLHHDHVAAMDAIRAKYSQCHLHTNSTTYPPQPLNHANAVVHLGRLRITHRATPGHTEEGVTYIIDNWPGDAPRAAIVGDALFAGSIGRGFQSWDIARQTVREQILSLPPDTLVCPGHGPFTTVGEEKENNPFF